MAYQQTPRQNSSGNRALGVPYDCARAFKSPTPDILTIARRNKVGSEGQDFNPAVLASVAIALTTTNAVIPKRSEGSAVLAGQAKNRFLLAITRRTDSNVTRSGNLPFSILASGPKMHYVEARSLAIETALRARSQRA